MSEEEGRFEPVNERKKCIGNENSREVDWCTQSIIFLVSHFQGPVEVGGHFAISMAKLAKLL